MWAHRRAGVQESHQGSSDAPIGAKSSFRSRRAIVFTRYHRTKRRVAHPSVESLRLGIELQDGGFVARRSVVLLDANTVGSAAGSRGTRRVKPRRVRPIA